MPNTTPRTGCLLTLAVTLAACSETHPARDTTEDQADLETTESEDTGDAGHMCGDLVAEGDHEGGIAANWSLQNTYGEQVDLWDFCGEVIFFEEGAYW